MTSTLTLARNGKSLQSDRLGYLFETALGLMAVEFANDELHRIAFGYRNLATLRKSPGFAGLEFVDNPPMWVVDLSDRLARFADGESQEFGDIPLATAHLTTFAKRVVRECRNIPWGRVLTYAELAKKAGRPASARAVGNVMASNRFPLVVPCHRVVGSGGGLGGYSAPGGLVTKRRLLEAEGAR